jgi:hypothetical protein
MTARVDGIPERRLGSVPRYVGSAPDWFAMGRHKDLPDAGIVMRLVLPTHRDSLAKFARGFLSVM